MISEEDIFCDTSLSSNNEEIDLSLWNLTLQEIHEEESKSFENIKMKHICGPSIRSKLTKLTGNRKKLSLKRHKQITWLQSPWRSTKTENRRLNQFTTKHLLLAFGPFSSIKMHLFQVCCGHCLFQITILTFYLQEKSAKLSRKSKYATILTDSQMCTYIISRTGKSPTYW